MTKFAISTLLLGLGCLGQSARAQSPGAIYTFDNTGNAAPSVESWVKNFGTNTVTISNSVLGELTITETGTAGEDIALSDGANRVRESLTSSGGGTDLTGLDFLEFDLGHNGSGPIDVAFYVQASTGFSFVPLGPDLSVAPGMATYQVPLSGLTPEQAVYIRTMGFNARDHLAVGNVTWTLREVRSGGTPLTQRNLITHDTGTPEGGLQGAIGNFDVAAIQGNNGGQNQTGLSHDPSGTGALQWVDLGGSNGAAISWGNGTAWNGNTFNMRTTDLSNYDTMIIRLSAEELTLGDPTEFIGLSAFFQTNNFSFQGVEGGVSKNLPTDGQFYEISYSLAGLASMEGVDLTGINLDAHATNLRIRVDNIQFIPEPATGALTLASALALLTTRRRRVRDGVST